MGVDTQRAARRAVSVEGRGRGSSSMRSGLRWGWWEAGWSGSGAAEVAAEDWVPRLGVGDGDGLALALAAPGLGGCCG